MPYSLVLERASGTHNYSVQRKVEPTHLRVLCSVPVSQAHSNKFRFAALEALCFISLWCLGAQRKGMVIIMSRKEKFPLYLSPEKKAALERRYTEDGSRSITGFIENAIDFYLDYLSANNAGLFLPSSVQSYLDGRLDQFENRIASLLFKQAVELDMGMHTLADCVNLDDDYLRRQRANSIANVKRTNGRLRLEQIAKKVQAEDEDAWQD